MKIGIDCRIWGVRHGGIGRYTQELVQNLQQIDKKNNYILFCRKKDMEEIGAGVNFQKVLADIRHYTLAEQLKLPQIFTTQKLDLLHVPHFNVPILYRGRYVTTIHDLIWHDIKGLGVTTLSAPTYFFKYIAYRSVVRSTIARATKIIVPSNTIKGEMVRRFLLQPDKVVTTYEGATVKVLKKYPKESILGRYKIKQPYILYVGSLYPHKNVEVVARALKTFDKPPTLVIVSARNIFQKRFGLILKTINAEELVHFVGYVSDNDLAALYNSAEAYVFPSLSEGFGLPGLEAMSYGTPVLASDIPVLKEIYADASLYFDPKNAKDLADRIKQITDDVNLRSEMIKKGYKRINKFSWKKMARETLMTYFSAISA